MTDVYREREDKYDVPADFAIPDLVSAVSGATVEVSTHQLEATYYDTSDRHLQRRRITLRRRTGGDDAGWHLKLPAGTARTEIRASGRSTGVPRQLSALLLGVREGHELIPAATISTTRVAHVLVDDTGRELAEVADDSVRAVRLASADGTRPAVVDSWREVEVEAGPAGGEETLTRLGELLVSAGAAASASSSKLARAMGPLPEAARPRRLGRLVDDYLQEQYDAILAGDIGLRRGDDVVHPTRVAIRRLRSTVRVFGELFETDKVEELEAELVWYAGLLGSARDLDILRERLTTLLAALPGDAVLGPVSAELDSVLAKDRADAGRTLEATLRGQRYLRLLTTLAAWRDDPPFTSAADQRRKEVRRYLDAADKKLRRRVREACAPDAPDELLHRARKAGKRLRYAAELAEPTLGKRATATVRWAKDLQTLLGEHQDTVLSVALLRRLGAAGGAQEGQNGFTYGVLLAKEWQRVADTRAEFVSRYR